MKLLERNLDNVSDEEIREIANECYGKLIEIWDLINDDFSDVECFDKIVAVFMKLGHSGRYEYIFG
ncbi:MAG: hypothetical protein FWD71_15985 [Oscillospiraceae bacterium]|nr:hypothetical protein [Oscillospiraceae bacterium]